MVRIGELLGLTWDCVDISEEAISENRAYVFPESVKLISSQTP